MPQLVSDLGPVANQLNIPAVLTVINDISLTIAGVPGNAMFLGQASFYGASLDELCDLTLFRNGAAIPGVNSVQHRASPATHPFSLSFAAVVPVVPGELYQLAAASSLATADINAGRAMLTMIAVPVQNAVAPQAIAT